MLREVEQPWLQNPRLAGFASGFEARSVIVFGLLQPLACGFGSKGAKPDQSVAAEILKQSVEAGMEERQPGFDPAAANLRARRFIHRVPDRRAQLSQITLSEQAKRLLIE